MHFPSKSKYGVTYRIAVMYSSLVYVTMLSVAQSTVIKVGDEDHELLVLRCVTLVLIMILNTARKL
jgi:hypothetical protein